MVCLIGRPTTANLRIISNWESTLALIPLRREIAGWNQHDPSTNATHPERHERRCRTSTSACSRIESAGVFAVSALFSKVDDILFNFAILFLLLCEFSALRIAFSSCAIWLAGRACERDNWST